MIANAIQWIILWVEEKCSIFKNQGEKMLREKQDQKFEEILQPQSDYSIRSIFLHRSFTRPLNESRTCHGQGLD